MSTTIPTALTPRQLSNRARKLESATLEREAREAHVSGEHVGVELDRDCTACYLRGTDNLTFLGNAHDAESLERLRVMFTAMNRERVALTASLNADLERFEETGAF